MSLDKAIKHGKEKRKQYTGARAVDPLRLVQREQITRF